MKTTFKVWKTIKLGTHKNADELCNALKENGFKFCTLGNFTVASAEEKIQLVKLSVAELGFKDPVTIGNICSRAKELGLELCPNEVGPQLRLQYKDQPNYEFLSIVIEPIVDSGGDLNVFALKNLDGLWLYGHSDPNYHLWYVYDCVVLRLPN